MFHSSLVKFANRRVHRGQQLHWHRADMDGSPFRGEMQFLTEEEYEQKVVRVGDPQVECFNLLDPVQKKAYLDVVDGIVNKWFELVFIQRFIKIDPPTHYVEWVEYFYEDGTRAPFAAVSGGGPINGQQPHSLLFGGPPEPPHQFPPGPGEES